MSKDSTKKTSIPLTPLNGKVIVLPEEKQKVTASGLYLADSSSSSEKPQFGMVVKVGMEKIDEKGNKIPFSVKEGMKIMFRKYAGDEVEFENVKYILMDEEAIMAIFED